eukprot:SAG31_NODE_3141_length_4629_cov_2.158057_5_plen_100_part_00
MGQPPDLSRPRDFRCKGWRPQAGRGAAPVRGPAAASPAVALRIPRRRRHPRAVAIRIPPPRALYSRMMRYMRARRTARRRRIVSYYKFKFSIVRDTIVY